MQHKKERRLALGPNASLQFEDFHTMQYQVQEMLRAERIFKASEIQEEIDTYNELIPDLNNWKATLLFEYEDSTIRGLSLARMPGIEHRVFVQIGNAERILAIANEDLDRTNEEKTSAVHFLRFQFTRSPLAQLKENNSVLFGIDHPEMPVSVEIGDTLRRQLIADLDD